jgi:glutamine---fructose-6-phosphate transaminase (isomerizing)
LHPRKLVLNRYYRLLVRNPPFMPLPAQTLMFAEAGEAAEAVARQAAAAEPALAELVVRLHTLSPPLLFTCARGSSDHAATFAKFLFETRLGLPTVSQHPSISSLYGDSGEGTRGAAFFAISQSGRSPDLLAATGAARSSGALVATLVNDTGSPLAQMADIVLPLSAGPEASVAATKSYIATLAMIARLVARWAGDAALSQAVAALPETLAQAWEADWTDAVAPLAAARSLFVLGRGSTLGIAQEAALKLKETSAIHAEAFSLAEVAHGPMTLAEPGFPVLVFPPQDADPALAQPVYEKLSGAGSRLLIVGEDALPIAPGLHPAVAPIAMIQSFYRVANAVALARGRDPDRPPLLSKVTQTR